MDGHYYDDPIENYDPDENTRYFTQKDGFSGQTGSYGDLDLDDLDIEFGNYMRILTFILHSYSQYFSLGLSSPSPMRILEPSQNRIYLNHPVHTVRPGVSTRQHHDSENQQRIFRGFQNNGSSLSKPVIVLLVNKLL